MSRNYRINASLLRAAHNQLKPDVPELCKRVRISRTLYYKIIRGEKGSPRTVGLVSRELGLDPAAVVELALPA